MSGSHGMMPSMSHEATPSSGQPYAERLFTCERGHQDMYFITADQEYNFRINRTEVIELSDCQRSAQCKAKLVFWTACAAGHAVRCVGELDISKSHQGCEKKLLPFVAHNEEEAKALYKQHKR